MEKILVVIMVFASISGMIWRMVKMFRGDGDSCCGCHGCSGGSTGDGCHDLFRKGEERS